MKADFLFELGTEELPSSAVEKLGNLLLENLCEEFKKLNLNFNKTCLLYTSPSPRDRQKSRMPS